MSDMTIKRDSAGSYWDRAYNDRVIRDMKEMTIKRDSAGSYTVTDIDGREWCVYKNTGLAGSEKWIAYLIEDSSWTSDPLISKKEAILYINDAQRYLDMAYTRV